MIPLVQDYLTDKEALCSFRPTCKYISEFKYILKRAVGSRYIQISPQHYNYKNVIVTDLIVHNQFLPSLDYTHLVRLCLIVNESCTLNLSGAKGLRELYLIIDGPTQVYLTLVKLPLNLTKFVQHSDDLAMRFDKISIGEFPDQLQTLSISSIIEHLGELPDTLVHLSLRFSDQPIRLGNSLTYLKYGGSPQVLPDFPDSLEALDLEQLRCHQTITRLPNSLKLLRLPFYLALNEIDMNCIPKTVEKIVVGLFIKRTNFPQDLQSRVKQAFE